MHCSLATVVAVAAFLASSEAAPAKSFRKSAHGTGAMTVRPSKIPPYAAVPSGEGPHAGVFPTSGGPLPTGAVGNAFKTITVPTDAKVGGSSRGSHNGKSKASQKPDGTVEIPMPSGVSPPDENTFPTGGPGAPSLIAPSVPAPTPTEPPSLDERQAPTSPRSKSSRAAQSGRGRKSKGGKGSGSRRPNGTGSLPVPSGPAEPPAGVYPSSGPAFPTDSATPPTEDEGDNTSFELVPTGEIAVEAVSSSTAAPSTKRKASKTSSAARSSQPSASAVNSSKPSGSAVNSSKSPASATHSSRPSASAVNPSKPSASAAPPSSSSTPPSSGSGSGAASATFPEAAGESTLSAPMKVTGSFDGKNFRFGRGVTCGGQSEGGNADAVFQVEEGGTLSNVIIGADQIEGIHCMGSCTLNNVWWEAVCEDAVTIKQTSGTSTINGGGAKGAEDKVIQHNGGGTVSVSGFYFEDFGKAYRSCGNCDTQTERHVIMDSILATTGSSTFVGINSNYGDTATITNSCIKTTKVICEEYEGNDSGAEPKSLHEGPSAACKYTEADISAC